jgi:hypothetical protein
VKAPILGEGNLSPDKRMEGHNMLYTVYFANEASYTYDFGTHYRMSKGPFMSILHGVREFDKYFVLKHDAIGTPGFSSIYKCPAATRMLAYGAMSIHKTTTFASVTQLPLNAL